MEIIKKLFSLYIVPIKKAFLKKPDYVMGELCNEVSNNNFFVSYRLRPIKPTSMVPTLNNLCSSSSLPQIAVILQGPISRDDNFTLETIKYYKKLYPDVYIILSTWIDENEKVISDFKEENVFIVQSTKPKYAGILNVNYQIVSTLAGVNKAEELNAQYVIKTRTDQRVCKPYAFYGLCRLLEEFKPLNTNLMSNRILTLSTYVHNMFTPYFLSDFFYAGNINDIKNFFSCNLDTREYFQIEKAIRKKYSETMYPPEIYLTKKYLKNYLGQECTDTIREYWQCLKDYFICVGRDEVGLFTRKYNYSCMEHINSSEYSTDDNYDIKKMMGFDFWMWINLYYGNLKYKEEYEKETEVIF